MEQKCQLNLDRHDSMIAGLYETFDYPKTSQTIPKIAHTNNGMTTSVAQQKSVFRPFRSALQLSSKEALS